MKKFLCMGLALIMSVSLLSVFASAAEVSTDVASANVPMAMAVEGEKMPEEVVIDGEPGDIIIVGNFVFEIVTSEEVEEVASEPVPYSSTTRWTDVSLSGNEMSKKFEVTASYPYAKVWIDNSGSGDIKFTITRGSDSGTLVTGSDITIKAGKSASVYSTNAWPADNYYANFTCGKASMAGKTACRVASTIHELDI